MQEVFDDVRRRSEKPGPWDERTDTDRRTRRRFEAFAGEDPKDLLHRPCRVASGQGRSTVDASLGLDVPVDVGCGQCIGRRRCGLYVCRSTVGLRIGEGRPTILILDVGFEIRRQPIAVGVIVPSRGGHREVHPVQEETREVPGLTVAGIVGPTLLGAVRPQVEGLERSRWDIVPSLDDERACHRSSS